VLSDDPVFFLVNSYTTGLSATVLANMLEMTVKARYGGVVRAGDVGLPIGGAGLVLPAGTAGRWEARP
jgi:23S rRNA (cytosine1962-C5)-methyltransferase